MHYICFRIGFVATIFGDSASEELLETIEDKDSLTANLVDGLNNTTLGNTLSVVGISDPVLLQSN